MFPLSSTSRLQLLLCVVASVCCTGVLGAFFAVVPSKIYRGENFTFSMTAHNDVTGPINVIANVKYLNKAVGTAVGALSPGETRTLSMQIPEMNGDGRKPAFSIETSGAISFIQKKDLEYDVNQNVILVETDKMIYKPGQKVRIRIIQTDRTLRPLPSPVTVFIVNPQDSKVEEYRQVSSNTGVVERIFELSDYASQGKWSILVTENGETLYTSHFEVEEYVLPKFSVDVKAEPGYVILDGGDSGMVILVEAIYTYGKGVQGQCTLTLSTDQHTSTIKAMKELASDGTATFTELDWEKLIAGHRHMDQEMTVTAEVTDVTGRTEAGKTTVLVYRHSIKLQILEQSTSLLRSGLPAHIDIRLSDHSGNPVGPGTVQVMVTTNRGEILTRDVDIPAGTTDATVSFTPTFRNDSNQRKKAHVVVRLTSNSEVMAEKDVRVYYSKTKTVVMIEARTEQIVVGQRAEFSILHDHKDVQHTLAYAVMGQGNIIESGQPVDDIISIIPTQELCPQGQLLVYMLAGNEKVEVVVDTLELAPLRCFEKEVSVTFDAAETRVGSDVSMQVQVDRKDGSNAMPGIHDVYYLAVDKSIILLQGQAELTEDEVMTGLSKFGKTKNLHERESYSAGSILQSIDLEYFTSTGLQIVEPPVYHHYDREGGEPEPEAEPDMADAAIMFRTDDANNEDKLQASQTNAVSTVKVRKNFPDTWLWGHAQTQLNGRLRQPVTLPDTITTWSVSAFAINNEGLAICRNPFQLRAFQIFFLTMNLPYSVKRGEVFTLRVTVFNYRPQQVDAIVRLNRTSDFVLLESQETDGWNERNVVLPPNKASTVEFKINVTTLGLINLHVMADDTADGMKDEVTRKLLVKPEGEERSRAMTKVLILTSSAGQLDQTFNIPWPVEKIVPGSRRVEVKITGDVFGQALSNLDRLVRVPFGCGEQNMITTVPNIFGVTYIKDTQQLGQEEVEQRMLQNMKRGYQREVDLFRHRDGSYSAWGEKNGDKGSTWLTAFVIKSFAQASKFMTVDPEILSSGVRFLRNHQTRSGTFREDGRVLHQEIQSNTGSGIGLTVYTLISLLETTRAMGKDLLTLDNIIDRAINYLMENLNIESLRSDRGQFLPAMTAYAFSLVPERDSEINMFIDELLQLVLDLDAPWSSTVSRKVAAGHDDVRTYSSSQSPKSIEVASYYLLTLSQLGRVGEGVVIMKWLQSQQNSFGGYHSTQDTVMGLQALSTFGSVFAGTESKGTVKVVDQRSGQSYDVDISGSRSILLQTVELSGETESVQVSLRGPQNSIAIVKVVYVYYTQAGDDDQAVLEPEVSIYTRSSRVSPNVHRVEACVKSSRSLKYNGMFVATLTLPSGERAMEDTATILANNPQLSKVETSEEAIHFYMQDAPGKGYCLHTQLERELDFEVQKPGSAKIYPYYEPDMAKEVAFALQGPECVNNQCGTDSAVMLNMASVLLTVTICTLISLLLCV